jgi:hypothetical protein
VVKLFVGRRCNYNTPFGYLFMASPYDDILKEYNIPKTKLYEILDNPLTAYRTIHRKKIAILLILKRYQELLQKTGTEYAKQKASESIREIRKLLNV